MYQNQTRKEISAWLRKYQTLKTETELLQAKFIDMVDSASGISGQRENDGSAHTAATGTALQASVERYLEYSQQIAPRIQANRIEMARIEKAVEDIPFPDCRMIIRERYLTGAEDEVLAKVDFARMEYRPKHINRLKTVREVAKIIRGYDTPSDCSWISTKQAQALDYLALTIFNTDSTKC